MEGPLWLKTKKEYLDDTEEDSSSKRSKRELQGQILLSSQKNLHIKKMSLPSAGKSNAFVISNSIKKSSSSNSSSINKLKILVAAKNGDILRRWIEALSRFCQQEEKGQEVDDQVIEQSLEEDEDESSEKDMEVERPEWMEVVVTQQKEMSNLLKQHDFTSTNRLRTTATLEWTLDPMNQVDLPQGSILLKVNGTQVQGIERMTLLSMLQPEKLPLALRFYLPIYKQGCLKYKNTKSLSHQLKTTFNRATASTITTGWKERVVIVATDTLMYHQVSGTPRKKQNTMKKLVLTNCQVYQSFVNTTSRSLVGGGAGEEQEQEEDKHCFTVAISSSSSSSSSPDNTSRTTTTTTGGSGGGDGLVFQVRNEFELVAWIRVIERAIQAANCSVNTTNTSSITSAAAGSSMTTEPQQQQRLGLISMLAERINSHSLLSNIRPKAELSSFNSTDVPPPPLPLNIVEEEQEQVDEWEVYSADTATSSSCSNPSGPQGASSISTPPPSPLRSISMMPSGELSDLLVFLQRNGRFVEALQLMAKNNALRPIYWKKMFAWAIEPFDQKEFEFLLTLELNEEDAIQVQKDVPRTVRWLSGCFGAPVLTEEQNKARLVSLEKILHAFLMSCTGASDRRTDHSINGSSPSRPPPLRHTSSASSTPNSSTSTTRPEAASTTFYMQGMNGIAFVLLQVLAPEQEEEEEMVVYQFFRGIISRILPHVFGICFTSGSTDHFDLFKSLMEVGQVVQEVVHIHLPHFHSALEEAGIPVCILAYKWFPTLFSDVSLTANHSQLRWDTLLAIWDICFLMGLEGIFLVTLALFSLAESHVLRLSTNKQVVTAEDVSNTLVRILSNLRPEELMTSVCEVIELCTHPVVLKLRNGHRRRLQLGYNHSKKHLKDQQQQVQEANSSTNTTSTTEITVRDLDSGKMFRLSRTGSNLVPLDE